MNILKISSLSMKYSNGVQALDGINIEIQNGILGLLGPNGAGKSSLMRIIATLQKPTKGHIHLNTVNILEKPDEMRKQLGYLPQEFGVYPGYSAYQLLDHIAVLKGITNQKDRKNQVEALLHQVNLYRDRRRSVSNFSGGMRQRFGIAQALLGNPKIVIVDEPTAGLDPEERWRFHNLLSEIASNMIVLLSTHIVEDIRGLCTNLVIMNEGQLVKRGRPDHLIEELHGKIWETTTEQPLLEEFQNKFLVVSSRLNSGKLTIRIFSENQPNSSFYETSPNLEDVYFLALATKTN